MERPTPLRPSAAMGVDLGGTTTSAAVVGPGGQVQRLEQIETRAQRPAARVVADLVQLVRAVAGWADERGLPLVGLGVGVPGVLDPSRRQLALLPNFGGGWYGLDLVAALRGNTALDVALVNDARAFTLAEATFGAARDHRDVLGITLGTGVGGGLVLGGALHLGARGGAGEFGHQVYDPHGPRCGCGGRGCIEVFASGPAVVAAATRAFHQGRVPVLRSLAGDRIEAVTAKLVADAARAGETECQEVYDRAAHALAVGIANVSALLGVEVAVVGGGLAAADEVLFGPLRRHTATHAAVVGDHPPAVVPARLGHQAGVIGAALWSLQPPTGGPLPDPFSPSPP